VPTIPESTLASWTGPASDAEDERHDNARGAITDAIRDSSAFDDADLSIYAKGSYPNHTNVVRDSDVDVAVEMTSIIYLAFEHDAAGMAKEEFGITPYSGGYNPDDLKKDIEAALRAKFGASAVTPGNKALHVRQSSTRLAADLVPCYTKRIYYSRDGNYHQGIVIRPDRGRWIDNFPKEHLDKGREKNTNTLRRYKSVVRILKRLENKMVDEKVISVVPSFLIESLVWNTPNEVFVFRDIWTERVKGVLVHVWEGLEPVKAESRWLEANGVQMLFGSHQTWTREEARQFAYDAWNYLGCGS
jgi:hypothetical protein